MKKYSYLASLLFIFCIPASIAAYILRDNLSFQQLVVYVAIVTIVGSLWDIWATRHGRRDRMWLWQFNGQQTLGIKLLDLPVEEYLFYVASSTYVILIWEEIKILLANKANIEAYSLIPGLGIWTICAIFVLQITFRVKRKSKR